MKTVKKVLSVVLAITMVLSAVVIAASAYAAVTTERNYWSLKAEVYDATDGAAQEAIDSGLEDTAGATTSPVTTKQQADLKAYDNVTSRTFYNSNDTIYVKPGQVVWVTVHLKTTEDNHPSVIQGQYYYSTNIFTATTIRGGNGAAKYSTTGKWSEYVSTKDCASWALLTKNNRKKYIGTVVDANEFHVYNFATTANRGLVSNIFYALDEDLFAMPIYVKPTATVGSTGKIFIPNNAPSLFVDSNPEGDPNIANSAKVKVKGAEYQIVDGATLNFVVGEKPGEVDYTALNAAIAKYDALTESDYTVDTWAAATTAYNAAKAALSSTDQATVTAAAEALEAAIGALKKPAALDFSGLTAAINAAKSKTLSDYTTSTANAVTAALAKAEAAISATTQDEIDAAAAELNAAVAALKAKANISTLTAAIAEANAKVEANYTADSWKVLSDAVAAGQAIVDKADETSDQAAVDVAANAIYAAINNLVPNGADYSAVEAAKAKIPADLSIYTDETVKALNDAVAAVVEGKKASEQAVVDGWAAAIETAISGLRVKSASLEELKAAIAEADALNSALYTPESFAAVTTALAIAKQVRDSDPEITDQTRVDEATAALKNAIASLVPAGADFSALKSALDEAKTLTASHYTADSWKAYSDAVAAGQAIYDNAEQYTVADQATIDAAAKAITDAKAALVEAAADYSAVTEQQTIAASKKQSDYTAESWANLQTALNAVVNGLKAKDQARVDKFAADIKAAIGALEYVDANYDMINNQKTIIAGLTETDYTKASWAALQAELAKVVEGKKIDEQDLVDEWADNIRAARLALVKAPAADYTDVNAAVAEFEKLDSSLYTAASVKKVEDAIAAVDYTLNENFQSTVDAYADAINAAIDALELKPAPGAGDYTAVDAAIAKFNAIADKSVYTDASVKAVEDAIAAVVRGLDETHQAEIDAMAKAINDAIDALELKPVVAAGDYKAVDAAIARANTYNAAEYTAESWARVDAAIKAVVRGLDETHQAEIDAMAAAIINALDALENIPASTGRVVSVEYTPSAFTLNTYNFKVTGRAIAIRLLVASDTTSTITLYRNNPAITVTSYNSNGEVVSDLAKDIAYEVWSINKSFVPNSYYVIARDNTGWEAVTDSTQLFRVVLKADDKDVKSITPAASTVKAGEKFDVTVVTGADVIKVRTRVDGVVMCTFDVFSYGTIGENSNTFNIFAKVYSKGEHTITVDVKTANGWETVDTISATVIGE